MKKLVLSIAVILLMGTTAFAQDGGGALRRSRDYETARRGNNPNRGGSLALPNEHGLDIDSEGTDSPLGGGIAVLVGLGAAYLVGKKRKED